VQEQAALVGEDGDLFVDPIGLGGSCTSFTPAPRSVHSDLDGDLATVHLLASKRRQCLLLLLLVTNIYKTVALAAAGLAESATNYTSRDNIHTSIGEKFSQSCIIDGESEVGNKDDTLRRLSLGLLAFSTGRLRSAGAPSLLRGRGGGISSNVGSNRSGFGSGLSSISRGKGLFGAGLALKQAKRSDTKLIKICIRVKY
jgi:hypothetical protein